MIIYMWVSISELRTQHASEHKLVALQTGGYIKIILMPFSFEPDK